MSDLIDRQAAIEALDKRFDSIPMEQTSEILMLRKDLRELPPAQLGTNLAEVGTDTISRQAAIDALKNDMASLDHIIKGMSANDARLDAYVSQRNQVNYDIYTINNLPPAQPERIKGHWIKISPANIYECSECGKSVMTNDICAYDFCHGCGAEMEK